jgi:hypothetical protein
VIVEIHFEIMFEKKTTGAKRKIRCAQVLFLWVGEVFTGGQSTGIVNQKLGTKGEEPGDTWWQPGQVEKPMGQREIFKRNQLRI